MHHISHVLLENTQRVHKMIERCASGAMMLGNSKQIDSLANRVRGKTIIGELCVVRGG